jgi:hypothetical protein
MAAQLGKIAGAVQPAGVGRVHQVDWTAPAGGDDGHAGCHGLLDRLAEGLQFARVNEEIEAGQCGSEVPSAEEPGEVGVGKELLQPSALRTIADDDQAGARDVR